jgi:exodeoxyribonuclease-3
MTARPIINNRSREGALTSQPSRSPLSPNEREAVDLVAHDSTPSAAALEVGTVRVGTYNLLNGGGGDRWGAQMDLLASLDLDVLCIQEAKHWDRRRLAKVFGTANALEMQPLFAPSAHHGCHLVTLYRWPRVRCEGFDPDMACGNFHHTASRAELSVDGLSLQVINTHLDPFSGQDRLDETAWLTEYAAPGQRTLLVGDLNTVGLTDQEPADWDQFPAHLHSRHRQIRENGTYGDTDRRAMAALISAGYVDPPVQLGIPAQRTAGYWSPEELWDHRSDYVLVAPVLAPSLCAYEVVDTAAARALADHLPVVATLDLHTPPLTGGRHWPRHD